MMTHKRKTRCLRGITAAFSVICACTLFGTKVYAADAYQVTIPTTVGAPIGGIGQIRDVPSDLYNVTVTNTGGITPGKEITLAASCSNTDGTQANTMYAQSRGKDSKNYPLSFRVGQGTHTLKADDLKSPKTFSDRYYVSGNVKVAGTYKGKIIYNAQIQDDPDYKQVTFDATGGTIQGQSTFPWKINTPFGNSNIPTAKRTGYNFDGWYTEPKVPDRQGGDPMPKTMPDHDVTYYAHWDPIVYNISYDVAGHGKVDPSWPTKYTIEDKAITIGDPAGLQNGVDKSGQNDMYFTGWTGTGLRDQPSAFTIDQGSTGDRSYKATWNPGGFRISCEDWTADYNGNPYHFLSSDHSPDYAKPGTVVSGSAWGDNTAEDQYYWHEIYHSCTNVTVSNKNEKVYRLFWERIEGAGRLWSVRYDASHVGFTVGSQGTGIKIYWKDRTGNVLHTEQLTGHIPGTYQLPTGPDGVTFHIDPASLTVNDDGKTLNLLEGQDTHTPIIRWHGGEDNGDFIITFQQYVQRWNEADHMFESHIESIAGTAYSDMTLTVDGVPTIVTDKNNLSHNYKNGAKIRFTGVTLKPGWIYDKGDRVVYYEGGPGKQAFQNLWTNEVTVDAPMTIDDGYFAQDAYGITFDANGGIGTHMNAVCIQNTGPDSGRTLPKCTYQNSDRQFVGWSISPNATEADYLDGAVMPKNLTAYGHYVTLYAVWKRIS